mmetsp:Transcript_30993/g.68726  ORF Transcript_30993/g.68726 Transcript_30993/m.68726 type:complete len:217 (+) Transcript_30993:1115-1765(+)
MLLSNCALGAWSAPISMSLGCNSLGTAACAASEETLALPPATAVLMHAAGSNAGHFTLKPTPDLQSPQSSSDPATTHLLTDPMSLGAVCGETTSRSLLGCGEAFGASLLTLLEIRGYDGGRLAAGQRLEPVCAHLQLCVLIHNAKPCHAGFLLFVLNFRMTQAKALCTLFRLLLFNLRVGQPEAQSPLLDFLHVGILESLFTKLQPFLFVNCCLGT